MDPYIYTNLKGLFFISKNLISILFRRKLNIVTQKLEFDPGNGPVVSEDRISSLPDELIHQILTFVDTKYAVQTSMLSSRWKLIWKSMHSLNFSSNQFHTLPKFSKFVTNVLSHRNHQIEVSSVKLKFRGAASQAFLRKIANYAFSNNVQELTVTSWPKKDHKFPPCLFNSQTLKHFTFSNPYNHLCITPKTPWDFPALTTLHLSKVTLCDDNCKSIDLFSKCVNLRNLTLETFLLAAHVEVFDIITPRLSNLKLIHGRVLKAINLVAPQLESLTIIDCSISYLNLPLRISSLCYKDHNPPEWFKDSCHSVNKVTVSLSYHSGLRPYNEEDFRKTINMLQELGSAKFLTLSMDIIECISAFPDLLSQYPSPFSNLISLNIDPSWGKVSYKVKMSTEATNFFLENSPNAAFLMDLPEPPPTKAMKAKAAREKNAKLIADIELHMKELQALVEHGNMILVERKHAADKTEVNLENLVTELIVWTNNKITQSEEGKESVQSSLPVQLVTCFGEIKVMIQKNADEIEAIDLKRRHVRSLMESLTKRQMAVIKSRYSRQLEEIVTLCVGLNSISQNVNKFMVKIIDCYKKNASDKTLTFQDASSSKLLQASEASSSFSATINTPSSASINPMP